MSTVTLLTGGGRSGKSTHALRLAEPYARKAFIATAEACDDEMHDRIARHRDERDPRFVTIEEPVDLAGAIRGLNGRADVAIVDCLTVWLANVMHYRGYDQSGYAEIDDFIAALASPPCDLIVVTNEVGMGIIPMDPMTRRYRDFAGTVNQRVAASADTVILMVSGIPVTIKPEFGG
ncbi:MAG: bifunctional adenosylcobinamide kinase/adenosylcobinamide-phosphate guanylyltransferase [Candidatus Hydrogenedentes bacterium]|nr:bifunctional adenosylcobinamide kinase/adenosylcobinamide-phosphate guanylyltransferase [Candidatus Hydrogenedentota bacterium]